MNWRKIISFVGLMVLLLSALPLSAGAAPVKQDVLNKIEAQVLQELDEKGQTDFFVWLTEQADVSGAYQLSGKVAKHTYVYETLRAHADRTQGPLRRYLDGQGLSYRAYYIANTILVQGGTYEQLLSIAARPDVANVTANHRFQAIDPNEYQGAISADEPNAVEPNISFVKADQVWAAGVNGAGTVMAGNDTGLYYQHPALIRQYRGCIDPPTCSNIDHNFNWWDATGTYPTVPNDGHGHGTHTSGTMVGDDGVGNQIGMAPGARLVHCKNMDNGGGGVDSWFLECFEWDLAPWDLNHQNANPALAPDAVNNSWGYWGGGQNQFRTAILNLQAAGTAVEVSAGNEGSSCQTLRSPGDYNEVLTTGSVNHVNPFPGTITGFSSRGPSSLDPGYYFPDIMAPGENIRSSVPGGGYQGGWSGTSMAGPHATGLIGLLWSACPAYQGMVEYTYDIIKATAAPLTGQDGSNCGGDYTNGPNNDWGYGTIDALAAVNEIIAQCGPTGSLEGIVTDAISGDPIEDALVTAGSWTRYTDDSGYYYFAMLPEGTYDVTAEHPLYETGVNAGVVIVSGTLTVSDFALTPRGRLWGYVTDYDNGFPLEGAVVTADNGVWDETDATGYYEMYLDEGTYDVTATKQNYAPATASVTIVAGEDTQQDFALQADIAFIPSPLHVTLPWDSTYNTDVTVTSRLPDPYPFEFVEQPGGFIPLLAQQPKYPGSPTTIPNVPVFTGVAPAGYVPQPASSVDGSEGTWESRANSPFSSMDNVFIEYNGMGYLVGGYGAYGAVGIYDPVANAWTTGATEPSPQIQYTVDGCFGLNENGEPVIVLFNDTTSGASTLHRYNIATNSWDTPPVPSGFPSNGLWAADMESLWRWNGQNVCYISGGANTPGGGNQSTLYAYHPDTNTVENLGNFTLHPAGFDFHASWYVPWIGGAGAICVGGGVDAASVVFADTQCYDIGAGVFNAPNADLGPMLQGVWGSADGVLYENGDYQIYVANGADAGFALWQGSMYYSQNDGQWHYGSNPMYGVYRVEGDNVGDGNGCDFYVVTGSAGGFSPTNYNERNVSASDECPPLAGADCLWLGEVPTSTTIPAFGTVHPTIYFTATSAVGVDQPGDYYCKLKVQGDPSVNVLVTMTVLPAATWGKLEGTVTGLGYCDSNPAPLKKATVLITTTSGMTWSLETDAAGHYSRWIDESESPVSIHVSSPGYESALATGVVIVGGQTTVQDFDLRWLQPCVGVTPDTIDVTLNWGDSAIVPMEISNSGAVSLDFVQTEENRGWQPMLLGAPIEVTIPAGPLTAPAGTAVAAGPYTPAPERSQTVVSRKAPNAAPNVLLLNADDDNDYGSPIQTMLQAYGDLGTIDLYDARYGTPTLAELQAYDVVVVWSNYNFADPAGIGNVLADYVDAGGKVIDMEFAIDSSWGMQGRFVNEDYSAMEYGATLYSSSCLGTYDPSHPIMEGVTNVCENYYRMNSTTLTPGSTAVAWWSDNYLFVAVKDNRTVVTINDYVGYSYQWTGQLDLVLHNAILWLAVSPDVPWLFENPISGTVAPDGGVAAIDVTVDSTYVNQPGYYWATLHVESNDPVVDDYPVLVTMTVLPAANMGKVRGTVLDNCTGQPVEATIDIVGGIPITQTQSNKNTGQYAVWLVEGSYPVVFSADGYVDYNDTFDVVAGMTATLDVMLIPDRACLAYTPDSFEVWLLEGTAVFTHDPGLDLYNGGAQELTYEFAEISGSTGLAAVTPPADASTAVAPAGYVPALTRSQKGGWPLGGTVCIFKDANPWGSTAVETILSANSIPYEVHTSAEFGSLDFTQYGMIVFSGDQPQSFYDAYAGYVSKFENYVNAGGFLNFFSCDSGWNGGSLTAPLPGGMQWTGWVYENYNVIDDPTHPVVQGVPNPFYGNYASHGHFSNLPADAHIIAHEQTGGQPTIVEYRLGSGWFVAFGQPLEISYDWGWDAGTILWNTLLWGYAYIPAGDVWWVWEEPISGTVPSLSGGHVDIAFTALYTDATPMPVGTYEATLLLVNNDPTAGTQQLPATMHIVTEFLPPEASFTSNSPVCQGEEMQFTDTSDPGVPWVVTWAWDFGDGGTSTEQNPTHLYAAAGTYTVTLTITQDQTGLTDTYTAQVVVNPLPQAGFTYVVDEVTVTFTDASVDATSWLWDFGDGITDTVQNPVHTYAAAGTYTVTQWAFNDCGSAMFQEWVSVGFAPDADFTYNTPACLGNPVTFTNATAGTPPIWYEWDFGDGITDTVENPVHTYAAVGTYTVTLDAQNDFGADQATGQVEVLPLPLAAFTYTMNGLEVTFTDLSVGAASWLWDFGDGVTSTLQNPVHTYAAADTYNVTLEVTGVCGTNMVTVPITVETGRYYLYLPLIFKTAVP